MFIIIQQIKITLNFLFALQQGQNLEQSWVFIYELWGFAAPNIYLMTKNTLKVFLKSSTIVFAKRKACKSTKPKNKKIKYEKDETLC